MTSPTQTTQPSEQAMKAAELFWLSTGDHGVQELAVIIDRCTGLPALLAKNKHLLDLCHTAMLLLQDIQQGQIPQAAVAQTKRALQKALESGGDKT